MRCTEIIEYLSQKQLDFDYFIAADVFIYVGELSEVLKIIKNNNKRKGKLVFTTEHEEDKKLLFTNNWKIFSFL